MLAKIKNTIRRRVDAWARSRVVVVGSRRSAVLTRVAAPSTGLRARYWGRKLSWVYEHEGDALGLAAPQIGISRRICVVRTGPGKKDYVVLHNPSWEPLGDDNTEDGYEGCLSIPGGVVEVTRTRLISVRAEDARGRELPEIRCADLGARIVQHELDHLDGVLITDHGDFVTDEELALAIDEELVAEALAADTGGRTELADVARSAGFDPAEFGL